MFTRVQGIAALLEAESATLQKLGRLRSRAGKAQNHITAFFPVPGSVWLSGPGSLEGRGCLQQVWRGGCELPFQCLRFTEPILRAMCAATPKHWREREPSHPDAHLTQCHVQMDTETVQQLKAVRSFKEHSHHFPFKTINGLNRC